MISFFCWFNFVVLHEKFYQKNSEVDEVGGFICLTRRSHHTVTGTIPYLTSQFVINSLLNTISHLTYAN